MKTYSFENGYGTTYTFEIVNSIPKGYHIWSIPMEHMAEGLIPLCELDPSRMTFEGARPVNLNTLKALYIPDDTTRAMLIGFLMMEGKRGLNKRTESAKKARAIVKNVTEK